jgi:N6-adenosine-specific RNA methylase IME4
MSLDAICALPVGDLFTPDAVLFLWTTGPHLADALTALGRWGFTYVTNLVWEKDSIGLGYWVRNQHEILLVAKRGKMRCPPPDRRPPSVIHAPRREHSEKPDEVYALIENMYPELPRIELFARRRRPGWTAWGNEIVTEAA